MGGSKAGAIGRALADFDGGGFEARLAGLVAIRSTSQDAAHAAHLPAYLDDGIGPWLRRMGFTVEVQANPAPGHGPILVAVRREDAGPTVLTYGYGNSTSCIGMRGYAAQYAEPLGP